MDLVEVPSHKLEAMPPTRSTAVTLIKEDAEQKVKEIMRGIESRFQLVPFSQFQKSHQGSSLKSNQYQKYFVLCHANSMYHPGWFVCPYVTSGFCPIQKGIMEANSRKLGTNKFRRHAMEHEDTRERKKCWNVIWNPNVDIKSPMLLF